MSFLCCLKRSLQIFISWEKFEYWDWGKVIVEGPWLDAPMIYKRFIDQMVQPWVSIQFSRDPYPLSEMISSSVSKRMTSSQVWAYIDKQLQLLGCENSHEDIDFQATIRVKASYASLLLTNARHQKRIAYFLAIRITDKLMPFEGRMLKRVGFCSLLPEKADEEGHTSE